MLRALWLPILLFGAYAAPSAGQTGDPATIVASFFPTDRLSTESPNDRQSCFVVYETNPGGEPKRIVATYTNTVVAVTRIVSLTAPGTYIVTGESATDLVMPAAECHTELVDVDFDSSPEVLVQLLSGNGSATWVWRIAATAPELVNITATETLSSSQMISAMANTTTIDLYHDGTLQLYALNSTRPVDPNNPNQRNDTANQIFRLTPTGFAPEKELLFAGVFADLSQPSMASFKLVEGGVGPYYLRVVNGDRLGQHRVTAGSVKVNGTEVVGAALNSGAEFVEVNLGAALPVRSVLEVALTGPAGASVVVSVEERP